MLCLSGCVSRSMRLMSTLVLAVAAMPSLAASNDWPKLGWSDVGHQGSLSTYNGPSDITVPGTVIENAYITGIIRIQADNVTIRNSRFYNCRNRFMVDDTFGAKATTIENVTFEGSDGFQLRTDGGIVVRASRFRDAKQDIVKVTGQNPGDATALFEGNYFHGLGANPDPDSTHADGFQINRSTSDPVVIRGNTFETPDFGALPSGGCLATAFGAATLKSGRTIFIGDSGASGPNQTALIEYNFINGSQYGFQTDNVHPPQNVVVRYNVIGLDFKNAPWSGSFTKYGNVWEESGVVLSGNISSGHSWYGPWVAGETLPGQSADTGGGSAPGGGGTGGDPDAIAAPTISPLGGDFINSQQVTVEAPTEGSVVRYTTDGSTPSASSPVLNGPFYVNDTVTLKVLAEKDGSTSVTRSTEFRFQPFTASSDWRNIDLDTASDSRIIVEFTVQPLANGINFVLGVGPSVASNYTDLAAIVRFGSGGQIDARNGGQYESVSNATYTAGEVYTITMDIDTVSKRYSVRAEMPSGQRVDIATDFEFRTEQANANGLRYLSHRSYEDGEGILSNVVIGGGQPNPPVILLTSSP